MNRKAVFLNFHPAFYPPTSGGELRYWNLATRVSELFETVMVNPTFGEAEREEVQHAPHCKEIRVPKNKSYNAWHHFFDRSAKFKECSGLVSLLSVKKHPEYLKEVERETADADVVLHSSPFVFPAYPFPKQDQLFIYDSYNVESQLAKEALGKGLRGRFGTAWITRQEKKLCQRADLVLSCSQEDSRQFVRDYGIDESKIIEIPNGVDTKSLSVPTDEQRRNSRKNLGLEKEQPSVLFFGSFHPPNLEAAEFIVQQVAPQLPEVEFLIAGKVCEGLQEDQTTSNIQLLGLVSEETKQDLLHGCDIALNPMFSGSGTNLKMLDFMAAGLCIITTPLGARGLSMENDFHGAVIDAKYFVRAIQDLANDKKKRSEFQKRTRDLATEKFDWDAIGDKLKHLLEIKMSRRVLMLNDYPMTPVTAGGKIRLQALGKELAKSGHAITLLTLTSEQNGSHHLHQRGFEEINIPRSQALRALDKVNSTKANCSTDDVNAGAHPKLNRNYVEALKKESRKADLILLNHCYMSFYANMVRGNTPVIYESHNVETLLKERLYENNRTGLSLIEKTKELETTALRMAKYITCVSDRDLQEFSQMIDLDQSKAAVAPNGVDCSAVEPIAYEDRPKIRKQFGLGTETTCVFLGSGHPPNAEAVRFLLEDVAPENKSITLLIVGSVCGWFHSVKIPENVVLMGMLSEQVKDAIMLHSDIALNPLFTGSGSSLKVPEYLRAGLPILSTKTGARGFDDHDHNGIVIVDREDFSKTLKELDQNKTKRREMAIQARQAAVQHYDWPVVLQPLKDAVNKLIEPALTIDEQSSKEQKLAKAAS